MIVVAWYTYFKLNLNWITEPLSLIIATLFCRSLYVFVRPFERVQYVFMNSCLLPILKKDASARARLLTLHLGLALRIRLWTAYSKRWSCWDGKPLGGGNSNMFGIFTPGEMIQFDWRSYFSNGWLKPPPRPRPCWNSICYDPVTIFVSDDIAKVIHPTVWQQRRKTFFENIVTHIFPAMFRQSLKKSFNTLYSVMYMYGQAPSFAPECNIPWRVY